MSRALLRSRWFAWTFAVLLLALGVIPARAAEEPAAAPAQKQDNVEGSSDMSLAIQAANFAVEGVKRRSPMMLLAAAELAGALKKGDKDTGGIKVEVSGNAEHDGDSLPPLEPKALVARAIEYCGDDADLKAAVEAMARKILSGERGLVEWQGKNLPMTKIDGRTYVMINTELYLQEVDPGQTVTYRNVVFEGQRPAHIVVIGDGDGDLDLYVYDEDTGGLIGKDLDATSICEVAWVPRREGPFRVVVHNCGRVWEHFYVLANW